MQETSARKSNDDYDNLSSVAVAPPLLLLLLLGYLLPGGSVPAIRGSSVLAHMQISGAVLQAQVRLQIC